MINSFSQALLAWYDANQRQLSWRGERDPYRIWLSEIMLQQTRAETVERYYRAFLRRFPTVSSLASAEEDEVMKLWEGLGYYSRARNLHKAAKIVDGELQGFFPESAKALCRLPGIGAYTAGAIASIAYDEPVPALDGNQARVISRVLASDRVLKSPSDLEKEALELLDRQRPGDYNQALMDLGAAICLPRRPGCPSCPVRSFCRAAEEGNAEEYPRLPPPILKREENRTVALVLTAEGILVRRRPSSGLLGGLWEFPNFEGTCTPEELERALAESGVRNPIWQQELPAAKHVFTHLVWHMTGHLFAASAAEGWLVADMAALTARSIPSAFRVYREIAEELLGK